MSASYLDNSCEVSIEKSKRVGKAGAGIKACQANWRCSPLSALTYSLVHPLFRHLSAICSEFDHYLLVKPHVHFRGALCVARVAKFPSKFLASGSAAVEAEELQ